MRNAELQEAADHFARILDPNTEIPALTLIVRGIGYLDEHFPDSDWLSKLIAKLEILKSGAKGIIPLLEEPLVGFEDLPGLKIRFEGLTPHEAYRLGFLSGYGTTPRVFGEKVLPVYVCRVWTYLLKRILEARDQRLEGLASSSAAVRTA